MSHRRLLLVIEPVTGKLPVGRCHRPETSPPVAGEADDFRFERQHLPRRCHVTVIDAAADQRTV